MEGNLFKNLTVDKVLLACLSVNQLKRLSNYYFFEFKYYIRINRVDPKHHSVLHVVLVHNKNIGDSFCRIIIFYNTANC